MGQQSKRIGILGGSFDPIHLGHLAVAEAARDQLDLDRVLFVPAALPPHKSDRVLAPQRDRVAMLELAIRDNPAFDVCRVELDRGGTSYTLDTLLHLKQTLGPSARLHFLIGADSAVELHTWHEPRRLLSLARFVVVPRPGIDLSRLTAMGRALGRSSLSRLMGSVLDTPEIGISSTDIRERVARGRSIRYLVPESVRRHIGRRGLYRTRSRTRRARGNG